MARKSCYIDHRFGVPGGSANQTEQQLELEYI